MRSRIVIVLTLIALFVSSLGLPGRVHACSMTGKISVGTDCGNCSASKATKKSCHEPSSKKQVHSKKGCCSDKTVVNRLDPATAHADAAPIAVPIFLFVDRLLNAELSYGFTAAVSLYGIDHPPPSAAVQGRTTYLRTAHLLI